jgi:SET domain-containing protein
VQKYVVGTSGIHGAGLFARNSIMEGEQVVEYVGKKISKAESLLLCEAGNPFVFDLDEQWDIDGSVEWNPARFANHSCSPNCEVQNEDGRLWMIALRAIAPGEELTYNYGYDFGEFREHPCACGTPECVGYIVAEEFHDTVRRILPKDG